MTKNVAVAFCTFSSALKDDITYRALPDLDDMLSHPMPTRILRSATPPPNMESLTSGKYLPDIVPTLSIISHKLVTI